MGSLCVSLQTKIGKNPLVSTLVDPFTVYFDFSLRPVSEKESALLKTNADVAPQGRGI